ncbi:hypothetical protein D8674_006420 [Pyrus ussuriensis x Pyrus communis]|uniref:Uncharacterized protein n=1 Tax=Pyrus ussuriensis x Pyrus communis TaxID=2448454 RepID=A0A5N5FUI7_9ROSA|nr:hypothetical protein D8674_006420 [Pyrus ussuriensis x Pyrus communis]
MITRSILMPKKTCMCSLTSHPGSFRCSLRKNQGGSQNTGFFPVNKLNMRRSAMMNSLVRISGVEGEWVKRALTALIRPCAHQQQWKAGFQLNFLGDPLHSKTVEVVDVVWRTRGEIGTWGTSWTAAAGLG